MSSHPVGISVSPVRTASDRRSFRLLPHRIYRSDPHWVAPPNGDVRQLLAPGKHPFCASGEMEFFLARRGTQVVGRIAAIENRDHNRHHHDQVGFFGFFESEDDPAVAGALLDAAAAWIRARGKNVLRGPTSPSLNHECGLLLPGGTPGTPVLMMPHNPPGYEALLTGWGLTPVMNLHAFWLHWDNTDTGRWDRIAERILQRSGAGLRCLDMKRFDEEVRLIIDIFNDAWADNWGFVPMNPREVAHMAKSLRPIVALRLSGFIMKDGVCLGMWLGVPDYNRVLHRLKGRLYPFGFLRVLRAKHRLDSMRVLLMGVRKEHQHLGLDAVLYGDILRAAREADIWAAEASWVLETNTPMINTMVRAGGERYRDYRIYEKSV